VRFVVSTAFAGHKTSLIGSAGTSSQRAFLSGKVSRLFDLQIGNWCLLWIKALFYSDPSRIPDIVSPAQR
jgi:hypothetical protein